MPRWPVKPLPPSASAASVVPAAPAGTGAAAVNVSSLPPPSAPALPETSRFSFGLTPAGAIDLDAMRPASRDRMLRAIKATKIPGADGAPAAVSDAMRKEAHGALSLLGLLAVTIAKSAGFQDQECAMLAFSADERTMLVEPAAAVLAKYAHVMKYREETELIAALAMVMGEKVTRMRRAARDRISGHVDDRDGPQPSLPVQ